jgi:acetyltransferase-like isoleucine patch superfamily enzyme
LAGDPPVQRDHRPYLLKRAYQRLQKFYTRRYLRPHFTHLGRGAHVMRPWHVEIFGAPIELGDCATLIACADARVRFSVWPERPGAGGIHIGRFALICPGVRISSAARVVLGDSCMLAHGVYITDSDWHGVYDRVSTGRRQPVVIGDNVWLGESAIVAKGVRIGHNSIVGAGAVVVHDVPANVVAAGNPARVVRELDPDATFTRRGDWYADPARLGRDFREWDRALLRGNTWGGWLRYLLAPRPGD